MNCSDEAHSHAHGDDHDHSGHGGGHAGHSHDEPLGAGPLDSLYAQVDLIHVTAMNALGGGESGSKVIK
jgi:hypothetical protein